MEHITYSHTMRHPEHYSLTLQCLALHQIQVVGLLQDSALEATAEPLQISTVNVEHESGHRVELESFLFGGRLIDWPRELVTNRTEQTWAAAGSRK